MITKVNYNEFIGKKINKLFIIALENADFICKCDCGKTVSIKAYSVISENNKSCGCLKLQSLIERSTKHGLSSHPLIHIHYQMIARCNNENHPRFKDYGARGIKVCNEWNDFITFYNWCMINGWQSDLEVDRRENNGNYSPENCRIVSYKVNNNNKRNNIVITYKGESKNLSQWAEELNLNYSMLLTRLRRHNLSADQLFETKNRYWKHKSKAA